MKVYISGPITGHLYEDVEKNFNDAELRLQENGFEVVNPLNNGLSANHTWSEHMKADIKLLRNCVDPLIGKAILDKVLQIEEFNQIKQGELFR